MRRVLFVILVFAVLGVVVAAEAQEEQLTIATYYPSPYGVYKTLRLFPSDEFNPGDSCPNAGEMIFDNSEQQTYVCANGKWEMLINGKDLVWFGDAGGLIRVGARARVEYKGCNGAISMNAEAERRSDGIYTRAYTVATGAESVCNCDSGWVKGTAASCSVGWCSISETAVTSASGVSLSAAPGCCGHVLYPGASSSAGWGSTVVIPGQPQIDSSCGH